MTSQDIGDIEYNKEIILNENKFSENAIYYLNRDKFGKLINWILDLEYKNANMYHLLGHAYVIGTERTPKSMNQAIEYYQKAYHLGHPYAALKLGVIMRDLYNDFHMSIEYLIFAASFGVAPAIASLCTTFHDCPKDEKLWRIMESNFHRIRRIDYLNVFKCPELTNRIWQSIEANAHQELLL